MEQTTVQSYKPLSLCREGNRVVIRKILGNGGFRKRLIELGLRRGKEIIVVRYAPLRDPMEVSIGGCHVSLRVEEAERINVEVMDPRPDE